MKMLLSSLLAAAVLLLSISVQKVAKTEIEEQITQVPFYQVKIKDAFWKPRIQTSLDVTVSNVMEHCQGGVRRLKMTADYRLGRSDELPAQGRTVAGVWEAIENAAYFLQYQESAALEAEIDSILAIFSEAMQDDGYFYVDHVCHNPDIPKEGDRPYSFLVHSHELYDSGHMFEAAVAYHQATGKEKFMDLARKNAAHVQKVFFEGGDPNYNDGKPIMQAPGHEEIELALCKLYRETANREYLEMARRFLQIRGVTYRPEGVRVMAATYAQQQCPLKDQREAVGHAVRAGYLYTAMADVDALTGDHEFRTARNAIWNNMVSTRMHITGGLGAVKGIEGFGAEYQLPNKDAYNETCAAVANVFFNYRQFQAEGDARYLDIMELSMFNGALAGIAIDGNSFFYENPLECDGVKLFNKTNNGRNVWPGLACCPPNILRMILQSPGYLYSHSSDGIYLTLYASSCTSIPLGGGKVRLEQQTAYPFDGKVRVKVSPSEEGQQFRLLFRIPTWSRTREFVPGGLYRFNSKEISGYEIKVNGNKVKCHLEKGFAVIKRSWKEGDEVTLNLPMYGRYVGCSRRVEANIGRKAVVRGPLVYCAEGAFNDAAPLVQNYWLTAGQDEITETVLRGDLLNEVVALHMPSAVVLENPQGVGTGGEKTLPTELTLIPYYAWGNRKPGNSMLIWLPETRKLALNSIPGYGYKTEIKSVTASDCITWSTPAAICDGAVASTSRDMHSPFWASIQQKAQPETLVVEFKSPQTVEMIGIYWIDRSENHNINRHINKVPTSWSAECRTLDKKWIPMEISRKESFGTEIDVFNEVHTISSPICDAVRLTVVPHEGYVVGISEVKFRFRKKK